MVKITESRDEILDIIRDASGYADAFGTNISESTKNKADIGSEYSYSPERWRLFINGQRQLLQYNSVAQFIDEPDHFKLQPNQGETMTFRTAEKFRYVVGYVIEPSMAYGISRLLEEGDRVVIGYGDSDLSNGMANADGWFFIYTPDLAEDEVEVVEYRVGTKVASKVVKTNKTMDIWKRMAQRINWYNVGANQYIETYTVDGEQYNPTIGKLSVDDGKGPVSANQRVEFSIQRGNNSSAITLETGSVGVKILGDVDAIKRVKLAENTYTFATTGSWIPILAMRIDPDRDNITCSLTSINITEWGGADDVKILAQVCDPSEVLDSGDNELVDSDYFTPELMTPTNSVIEVSENVAKAPDQNGNLVTSVAGGGNGTGGYNIGYTSFKQAGAGSNKVTFDDGKTRKRTINPGDVIVYWGFADNAAGVTYQLNTEQEW